MPQNHKFFKTWYIITDPNDSKTIETINSFNYENVKTIFYDFYKNGKIFNKGGAIKHVQQMIPENTLVLILDSDIYLPDDFKKHVSDIKVDKFYSSSERSIYYTYKSFLSDKHDKIEHNNYYGYFQLYTQNKDRFYTESVDASKCDETFRDLFKSKEVLKDLKIK